VDWDWKPKMERKEEESPPPDIVSDDVFILDQ
jgi:hypothetical protein